MRHSPRCPVCGRLGRVPRRLVTDPLGWKAYERAVEALQQHWRSEHRGMPLLTWIAHTNWQGRRKG